MCVSTEGARDAEEGLGRRGLSVQRAAVRPHHVRHPAQRRAVLRPKPDAPAKYELNPGLLTELEAGRSRHLAAALSNESPTFT